MNMNVCTYMPIQQQKQSTHRGGQEVNKAQAKAEEAQAKSGKAQLKAKAEGRTEGKIEVAKRMLNDNLSVELISKFTGLSQDEVDKLR